MQPGEKNECPAVPAVMTWVFPLAALQVRTNPPAPDAFWPEYKTPPAFATTFQLIGRDVKFRKHAARFGATERFRVGRSDTALMFRTK